MEVNSYGVYVVVMGELRRLLADRDLWDDEVLQARYRALAEVSELLVGARRTFLDDDLAHGER
jgi:hypothetical protein